MHSSGFAPSALTCAALVGLTPALDDDPAGGAGGARGTTVVRNGQRYEIRCGGESYAVFDRPKLGSKVPRVDVTTASDGWVRVSMRWTLDQPTAHDDLAIRLEVAWDPDLHWIPHLAPFDGWVVGQHVFRSPAIILGRGVKTLALVPDLDLVGRGNPWYLDWDAPNRTAAIGMSEQDVPVPVLFRKRPGMRFAGGVVELGFFVRAWEDLQAPRNPWGAVASFLWGRHGGPAWRRGEPDVAPMEDYVAVTHEWLFDRWRHPVWQEFDVAGRRAGGAVNVVDVTLSSGFRDGSPIPFELGVWNQAWFSSLRAAAGRFRVARWTGDAELLRTAGLGKALALSAPQDGGLFPSVLRVPTPYQPGSASSSFDEHWGSAIWTGSDRTPVGLGITRDWYHVADMSSTALQMLRWHRELDSDPELLEYVTRYGNRLLALQAAAGFFPAWLHPVTHAPSTVLADSPETSVSSTFLLELESELPGRGYGPAGLAALDAVLAGPAVDGRWEDFETYWSNSSLGASTHVGRKWQRNGVYKQNNLSIFWTAEAALRAFESTRDPDYLAWGRRVLDELSMFQQVWTPPFIHVPALGGFGVMNADGEWNDARQSLFAELYLDYYRLTGEAELFERGVAALRAGWVMMYTPLNPGTHAQWQAAYPFLSSNDHGLEMENYGRFGVTDPHGGGVGWFSIYTWGAGAAAEAFARVVDRYGHVYVDRRRGHAFGIDGIIATHVAQGIELVDVARRTAAPRRIRIVFEDGTDRWVVIDGRASIAP